MTQATGVLAPTRASETKLIAGVCLAHFVSHYYMVLLAPLFVFIRADYGVSYTELGLALTAFNITTALCQTPAGFLVDRVGARSVLISGLVVGAACLAIVGLVPSFWLLVALLTAAGALGASVNAASGRAVMQWFSARQRGLALGVRQTAIPVGGAVAALALPAVNSAAGRRRGNVANRGVV